jgi:hypothetical protein
MELEIFVDGFTTSAQGSAKQHQTCSEATTRTATRALGDVFAKRSLGNLRQFLKCYCEQLYLLRRSPFLGPIYSRDAIGATKHVLDVAYSFYLNFVDCKKVSISIEKEIRGSLQASLRNRGCTLHQQMLARRDRDRPPPAFGSSSPSASRRRTPRAWSIPAPPSDVPESPHPMTILVQPESRACFISSPTP